MVILIMTLIIFVGSLYFLKQFYSATTSFRDEIDRNTDEQMRQILRDGSIVAIPLNKATIPVGKGESFWVGIQNIKGAEKDFGITVEFSKAFTPLEAPIATANGQYINPHWILYNSGPHTIKNNDYKAIPVHIVVDHNMDEGVSLEKGTYSFNVCVWDATEYGPTAPGVCDGTSTQVWYTNKVYKIFVEVP
ncbi:MAG TPA: hypothetical protein VLJ21_04240 [Candidatus Binatia bacterium]|nr:hypothetical protein [Candidatus Binatia bacterium]